MVTDAGEAEPGLSRSSVTPESKVTLSTLTMNVWLPSNVSSSKIVMSTHEKLPPAAKNVVVRGLEAS